MRIIKGVSDPEMTAIADLAKEARLVVVQATCAGGQKLTPDQAYACDPVAPYEGVTIWVECRPSGGIPDGDLIADHHRPGDPGYGVPPAGFLAASSIGQVLSHIARLFPDKIPSFGWVESAIQPGAEGEFTLIDGTWWLTDVYGASAIPQHIVLCAAADHCLAAAYQGLCPGVEPDALMAWRAESRAAFQRRAVADVVADVESARVALRAAPELELAPGILARDLRDRSIPELPEAAAREGICFVSTFQGKVVCQAGTPAQITAFQAVWAPSQGVTGIYGDPERGFAGGRLKV